MGKTALLLAMLCLCGCGEIVVLHLPPPQMDPDPAGAMLVRGRIGQRHPVGGRMPRLIGIFVEPPVAFAPPIHLRRITGEVGPCEQNWAAVLGRGFNRLPHARAVARKPLQNKADLV